MSFSLLDVILFLGVSQGIFLAIMLRLIDNRNKVTNDVLSIIIGMAAIMLFGRVIAFRIQTPWAPYVASLVDVTIFLFGPLIYCYTRRLLFLETPVFRLSIWHYLPAFIHLFISVSAYVASGELALWIKENQFIPYFWFFAELLGVLSFLGYVIASFNVFIQHKSIMKRQVSYVLTIRRYAYYVLGTVGLFAVIWVMSFISRTFRISGLGTIVSYQLVWVSIPLFIYLIGYYSLRRPEIFREPILPKVKEEKARLKSDEIERLQERLQVFIEEEIYKTSDLSLKMLAEKLNTTSNNLSWLLNQVYQKSFYDYINWYRIQDVLECIDGGLHRKQTLLAIAYDAGFNSKSTFNKAFKQITSQTPSEYIKSKKVA